MNAFLAEMYKTAENIGAQPSSDDIEKMAEASVLEDMFAAEKVDVSKIDGDTILKLAHALFGEDSALLKQAEMPPQLAEAKGEEKKETPAEEKKEEKAEEKKEESMEDKVAEADFLGRVMAHSYVDELSNLEKAAALAQAKEAKVQQASEKLATADELQATEPKTTGSAILDKLAGLAPETPAEPKIDQEKVAAALAILKEAGLPFEQAGEGDERLARDLSSALQSLADNGILSKEAGPFDAAGKWLMRGGGAGVRKGTQMIGQGTKGGWGQLGRSLSKTRAFPIATGVAGLGAGAALSR